MSAKIIRISDMKGGFPHLAHPKPKPAKPSYTFSRSTLEVFSIALAFVCGMVIGGDAVVSERELMKTIWYSAWMLGASIAITAGVCLHIWGVVLSGALNSAYAIYMRPNFK